MDPFYHQEIHHIITLIQESISGSQTGYLLCHLAECLWIEIGLPFSPDVTPYNTYASYTTPSWYKSIWAFTSSHPILIKEDYPEPQILCHGDRFLMELFTGSRYKNQDLRILNYLRM